MRSATEVVFGHLPISFDDQVLQPRQWTVTQSIWGAELLRHAEMPSCVLELCAGAGQIGLLALALSAASAHRLVAVDVNPSACSFVRRNAEAAGLGDQVEAREGQMEEVLDDSERFELVIADPPWVEHDRVPLFPDDPPLAIDGGIDGLDLAFRCVRLAQKHLLEGGFLLLQLGTHSQTESIRAYLEQRRTTLTVIDVWLEPGCGALMCIRKGAGN
jgi:release factor glutamine methyltransferase